MQSYILQIDTATEICSVSVSLNGNTLNSFEASESNVHASKLTLIIDKILQDSGISYGDLSAVCVSKGPGSYTGLRIGVSSAKGLCYGLDIPLLAINTLDMMFLGYNKSTDEETIYVPMLDARRMEVYLEIFDANGVLLVPTQAKIIDSSSFEDFADRKLVLFGSGAAKLKETFSESSNIFIDVNFQHSSSNMSQLAFSKFNNNDFEDLVYFEPYYLKEFIATTPKKLL